MSRAEEAMGKGKKEPVKASKGAGSKKSKGSKKHPRVVHIKPTHNGKFTAEHEYADGSPNETHGLENMDELQQHLQDTMGSPGGGSAMPTPQEIPQTPNGIMQQSRPVPGQGA